MLRVFNSSALSQKQRFGRAILFGSLASIGLLVVYVLVNSVLEWEFSYAYILLGYAIGWVIQTAGRGVQPKFSILAAVLCFLVIFIGDLLVWCPGLLSELSAVGEALSFQMTVYTSLSIDGLLTLAFRAVAIYCAYRMARIV